MADIRCSKKAGLDRSWLVLTCRICVHVFSVLQGAIEKVLNRIVHSQKKHLLQWFAFVANRGFSSNAKDAWVGPMDWGLNYIADRGMELSHDLYKVLHFEDWKRSVVWFQVEIELTIVDIFILQTCFIIRCQSAASNWFGFQDESDIEGQLTSIGYWSSVDSKIFENAQQYLIQCLLFADINLQTANSIAFSERLKFLPQDPCGTVDEITALGLRHVGYSVPVELFEPFVEGGHTRRTAEDEIGHCWMSTPPGWKRNKLYITLRILRWWGLQVLFHAQC